MDDGSSIPVLGVLAAALTIGIPVLLLRNQGTSWWELGVSENDFPEDFLENEFGGDAYSGNGYRTDDYRDLPAGYGQAAYSDGGYRDGAYRDDGYGYDGYGYGQEYPTRDPREPYDQGY